MDRFKTKHSSKRGIPALPGLLPAVFAYALRNIAVWFKISAPEAKSGSTQKQKAKMKAIRTRILSILILFLTIAACVYSLPDPSP